MKLELRVFLCPSSLLLISVLEHFDWSWGLWESGENHSDLSLFSLFSFPNVDTRVQIFIIMKTHFKHAEYVPRKYCFLHSFIVGWHMCHRLHTEVKEQLCKSIFSSCHVNLGESKSGHEKVPSPILGPLPIFYLF